MIPRARQTPMSSDAVREALASQIGREVREDIWTWLVKKRWVSEVIQGETPLRELRDEYLELTNTFSGTPRKTGPQKLEHEVLVPPDQRRKTLSKLLAIEAARSPVVVSFREEVLSGRLIALDDLPAWIEDQNRSLGSPATWEHRDVLSYPVRGQDADHKAYVRPDSVLHRLKRLCSTLNQDYDWQEAQAVAFVLSGLVPLLPKARVTTKIKSNGLTSITLQVDPRLSSQEVASIYAKARNEVFKGHDKPMTDKHLELAVFLAEKSEDRATWPSLLKVWNQGHPDWFYSDWRHFARDARSAWERIRGLKWKSVSKEKGAESDA